MSIPSRAAAGLALAVLSASVGTSAANVALPALGQAFTDPAGHVQWVVVAYLLTTTAASVVVGSLGDRWGRKRVLIGGIATFTLGAAIAALSPSLAVLIAARALTRSRDLICPRWRSLGALVISRPVCVSVGIHIPYARALPMACDIALSRYRLPYGRGPTGSASSSR